MTEEIEENWKDKYLRALAEQENMRKRIQKENKRWLVLESKMRSLNF